MNKIVCVTGMPGAGKSVVSDYFVKNGYQFVRFGQITIDKVIEKGLAVNEKNERKVREDLRKKFGMAAFAILNFLKFKKLLEKGNVIADGLYSWSEYKFLKEKFNKKLIVIAVYAPPEIRYERVSKRKPLKKDTGFRFRRSSKKDTESRDYAEIENLEKGGPIAMADFTILNTKSKTYLLKQVKEIYAKIQSKK